MTGDGVFVSKVVDCDHGEQVRIVAVLGSADDWAAYSAAVRAVPKGLMGSAADTWVALNGLKMPVAKATFYFPVLNPKRYRP